MSDRIVRNPTFVIRNYLAHKVLPLEKNNQKLLSPLVSASHELALQQISPITATKTPKLVVLYFSRIGINTTIISVD